MHILRCSAAAGLLSGPLLLIITRFGLIGLAIGGLIAVITNWPKIINAIKHPSNELLRILAPMSMVLDRTVTSFKHFFNSLQTLAEQAGIYAGQAWQNAQRPNSGVMPVGVDRRVTISPADINKTRSYAQVQAQIDKENREYWDKKIGNHVQVGKVDIHVNGAKNPGETAKEVKKALGGIGRAANAASGGSTAHSAHTRGAVAQ
jgi:hypothetical protein